MKRDPYFKTKAYKDSLHRAQMITHEYLDNPKIRAELKRLRAFRKDVEIALNDKSIYKISNFEDTIARLIAFCPNTEEDE